MVKTADILKEILKEVPADKISDACFEGANIVLYTKDEGFFLDNKGIIKETVDKFKKRIELRPDPSICMKQEKAEKEIRTIIAEEAGIAQIIFDAQRSQVVIEAEKPGLAIGKQGELLREIRAKTLWVPVIRRTPAIRSKIIEGIRSVLYQESDYRRKFLDRTGHRIYDGWIREKKHEWVRISFLGGAREVGRSCLFLQTPESRIIIDCGVNVASEEDAYPFLEAPEFNIKELDAVIISHAHMDHIGFVPYLFKFGYRGPVYMTPPTRDVGSLLLLDYIKIAKSENKDPIFETEDVKEMVKHTITLDYEEVTDITPDVRITLYNAGHIIGSAEVHMHIANGLHNIVYTGDMKYGRTGLLEAANTQFPRVETLIMESTYGGKDNILPPQHEADAMLKNIIIETVKRGGKILMPTLGSGRAQEVMIMLEQMMKNKEIEPIPVYIDGLVWDITAINTAYPEYLNSNVRKQIFHRDENPFLAPCFKHVGSQKERTQVIEETGACVIVATSGMLVGGPSVEYLKRLAEHERNSLIFTCYQGEGSLGRRILNGEREIIFKEGQKQNVIPIKMEVHRLEITAHSDRRQLVNFAFKCNPRPKKIIVNHGEASRCLDLSSSLHKLNRVETVAPRNLDVLRVK